MKRFYLFNSPMTYHPRDITRTCLFLATKTESYALSLDKFCNRFDPNPKRKPKPDDVLAAEFIVTQALRFTFDVKHPFQSLDGFMMEMHALAEGHPGVSMDRAKSADELQQELLSLPMKTGDASQKISSGLLRERIEVAYDACRKTLQNIAVLTDVYFLYTPPQICFAAFQLADEVLMLFYFNLKFPNMPQAQETRAKVLKVISQCAAHLKAGPGPTPEGDRETKRNELVRMDKKLYKCLNPDKRNLAGLNKAQKRDQVADGKLEESIAKKRKLERETAQKESDEFWGPELKKSQEA
jgi:cyclin H